MMVLINESDNFALVVKNKPKESNVKNIEKENDNETLIDKHHEKQSEETIIKYLQRDIKELKDMMKSQHCKCKEKRIMLQKKRSHWEPQTRVITL